VSVVHILKITRQRVLASIQTLVPGVNSAVSPQVFAASSVFMQDSISQEITAAGKDWRVSMLIAAVFVEMSHTTLQNMATVLTTTLANESSWQNGGYEEFRLKLQAVCSAGAEDGVTRALCSCASDTKCAAADGGFHCTCSDKTLCAKWMPPVGACQSLIPQQFRSVYVEFPTRSMFCRRFRHFRRISAPQSGLLNYFLLIISY